MSTAWGKRFRWATGAVAMALVAASMVATPSEAEVPPGAPGGGPGTVVPTRLPVGPAVGPVASAARPSAKAVNLGRYKPLAARTVLDTRSGLGAPRRAVSRTSVAVKVAGTGGVASNAYAVAVTVTASKVTRSGSVAAYPDGSKRPSAVVLTAGRGDIVSGHTQVKVGRGGRIRLASSGTAHLKVVIVGWYVRSGKPGVAAVAANRYASVAPVRVLRVRGLSARRARRVVVAGRNRVPTSATAVAVNLTVTGTTAATNLTLAADGAVAGPASASLRKHGTASLLTVVPVRNRAIRLVSSAGKANVTVDVVGYYRSGTVAQPGQFIALTPAALGAKSVKKAGRLTVTVLGKKGTPVRGVAAALVRVTVSGASKAGVATAYRAGSARSKLPGLAYAKARTASNLALVKPGTGGRISVYTSQKARVRVDVVGWFSAATARAPRALGSTVKPPPLPRGAAADTPDAVVKGDVVRTTTKKSVKELEAFWTPERLARASSDGMPVLKRSTPATRGPESFAGAQKTFPIYNQGYESTDQYSAPVGRLMFYIPTEGRYSNCSATLVARNLAITAAHCVVDLKGNNYSNFLFIPEQMGNRAPYGSWYGNGAVYYTYYNKTPNRLDTGSGMFAADYALISFSPQTGGVYSQNYYPGDVAGSFPIMWDTPNGTAWMAGYPSEGSFFSKYCSNASASVNSCWAYYCWGPTSDYAKHYDGWYEQGMGCNGSGGISGGPVFQYVNGHWYLVSVVSNGPTAAFDPDGQRVYTTNLWGPYFNEFVGRLWNAYAIQ